MGFHPKTPTPNKDREEFGPGKKDLIICKECKAVYYYKSWHHKIEDYPQLKPSKKINFSLCPACKMIKSKNYEGEITVKNFPEDKKEELKNLIENFGRRAWEKDSQHRVSSIKEDKNNLIVHTTENQLAQRLGEKINEVFGKKNKVKISHSGEDVIRVEIVF